MLNLLSSIPPTEQVDALSKLDSALRTQRADVRNVSAFLAGVVKRMAGPGGGGGMGAHGGSGMGPPGRGPAGGGGLGGAGGGGPPYAHHSGPPPAGPQGSAADSQLAPAAAQVLDRLYAEGRLRRGDLDSRSMANLAALQPEAQAFVMHSFADRNLSTVRNMSGQGLACSSFLPCRAATLLVGLVGAAHARHAHSAPQHVCSALEAVQASSGEWGSWQAWGTHWHALHPLLMFWSRCNAYAHGYVSGCLVGAHAMVT